MGVELVIIMFWMCCVRYKGEENKHFHTEALLIWRVKRKILHHSVIRCSYTYCLHRITNIHGDVCFHLFEVATEESTGSQFLASCFRRVAVPNQVHEVLSFLTSPSICAFLPITFFLQKNLWTVLSAGMATVRGVGSWLSSRLYLVIIHGGLMPRVINIYQAIKLSCDWS